jgi:hypothetical protein
MTRERAVPRFHFDVREGTRFIPDEVGVELDSLDAAGYEAARVSADIRRDQLLTGDTCDVTVEVKDEQGQQVVTVRVSMETHRTDPAQA